MTSRLRDCQAWSQRQKLWYLILMISHTSVFHQGAEGQISAGIFGPNHPDAVPSFLIIGTAKGGTTDLFEQLANEAVNAPSARPDPPITRNFIRKEVGVLLHSFCIQELLLGKPRYRHYLERLGHPCANTSLTMLRDCVSAAGKQEFTIDATPTYVASPLLPHMLSVFSPWSKVIVMLRDPLDRAQSLYNHFLVEEGRWRDKNLGVLVDTFFTFVNSTPGMVETFVRLAGCQDVFCEADGWSDLVGLGLMDTAETALFGGGLYRYILAPWRLHYFRANRVMLIDSHTYFADRTAVMDQVVRFLYGRPLTPTERQAAMYGKAVCVKRHKTAVPSVAMGTIGIERPRKLIEDDEQPPWALSPQHLRIMTEFYDTHVKRGLLQTVMDMRQEGAWVVGFDAPPWIPALPGQDSGLGKDFVQEGRAASSGGGGASAGGGVGWGVGGVAGQAESARQGAGQDLGQAHVFTDGAAATGQVTGGGAAKAKNAAPVLKSWVVADGQLSEKMEVEQSSEESKSNSKGHGIWSHKKGTG